MIEIKCSNCGDLALLFKTISNVVDTAIILFSKNKIEIQGMDCSKTSLIQTFLNKQFFTEYSFEKEENLQITLDFKILNKIFKTSKNKSVVLKIKEPFEKIKILFENNETKIKYNINVLEDETEIMNFPTIDYSNNIIVSSKYLKNIVSDLGNFSPENLNIFTKKNKIYFRIKSDLSTVKYELKSFKKFKITKPKNKLIKNTLFCELSKIENSTNLMFNFDLIDNFIKNHISKTTHFMFKNDKPLKLFCDLKNNSNLCCYIAPNIE